MDEIAKELAQDLFEKLQTVPAHRRLLVGLAGVPASGKSTLGALVITHVNALLKSPSPSLPFDVLSNVIGVQAILVGLDGWHLLRSALDAMPDPELARAKRGAHWTFDGEGYGDFVRQLRADVARPHATVRASWHALEAGGSSALITAPSFDHALKDPVKDDIIIGPQHRIVIIEGLYTFLGTMPWRTAGDLLDERWFIDLPEEEARARLVNRHVLTGVAANLEEACFRADDNDLPNGRFIRENMLEPTRRIRSVDDPIVRGNNYR